MIVLLGTDQSSVPNTSRPTYTYTCRACLPTPSSPTSHPRLLLPIPNHPSGPSPSPTTRRSPRPRLRQRQQLPIRLAPREAALGTAAVVAGAAAGAEVHVVVGFGDGGGDEARVEHRVEGEAACGWRVRGCVVLGQCLRHVLDMPYIKHGDIHTNRMVTNTNANQSMYQKSTQETNTARSLTERAGEVSLVDGVHHRAQARLQLLFCCMWFGCMAWGERLTVRCGDTSRGTYNPPKKAHGV